MSRLTSILRLPLTLHTMLHTIRGGVAKPVMRAPTLAELHEIFLG